MRYLGITMTLNNAIIEKYSLISIIMIVDFMIQCACNTHIENINHSTPKFLQRLNSQGISMKQLTDNSDLRVIL